MTERWRLFVAAPLTDRLRADLAAAVGGWRERNDLAGARWTDADAWHLTLAFLGAVAASSEPRISRAVSVAIEPHVPMLLPTGGVGAFPDPRRARVLWYGVGDPDGRLAELSADVRRALEVADAGPFRAHVTLARARAEPIDARAWLGGASAPDAQILVDRIELMRSHLGGGPARYETLASMPLGVPAHA